MNYIFKYEGITVTRCCANCQNTCDKNDFDFCEMWLFSEEKFNNGRTVDRKSHVELLSEKYGWPLKIKARGFIARLCGAQPLNEGDPRPIYRFPGGESLVDEREMIPEGEGEVQYMLFAARESGLLLEEIVVETAEPEAPEILPTPEPPVNIINEGHARRAKENMSFSDYKQGSATAEYNATIAEVRAEIEKAKTKVSPEAQERLERLYERYCTKYAVWTNNYNRNGAGHVSVMISGPSNYNMRAHEKYLNREAKLWQEYDELKNISYKISAIVAGDKVIKSDDANAIDKLKDKLLKAQKEHAAYK